MNIFVILIRNSIRFLRVQFTIESRGRDSLESSRPRHPTPNNLRLLRCARVCDLIMTLTMFLFVIAIGVKANNAPRKNKGKAWVKCRRSAGKQNKKTQTVAGLHYGYGVVNQGLTAAVLAGLRFNFMAV